MKTRASIHQMTLSFRYVTLCFHELWVEMGVYEAMLGEAASPHCFSLFLPKDINFWDPQQLESGSLLQEKNNKQAGSQEFSASPMDSDPAEACEVPASFQLPSTSWWFHMCCLTQQHSWIVCQCWGPEQGDSFQAGLLGVPCSSLGPWGLGLCCSLYLTALLSTCKPFSSQSFSSYSLQLLCECLRDIFPAHLILLAYFMASCSLSQSMCHCCTFKCVFICFPQQTVTSVRSKAYLILCTIIALAPSIAPGTY